MTGVRKKKAKAVETSTIPPPPVLKQRAAKNRAPATIPATISKNILSVRLRDLDDAKMFCEQLKDAITNSKQTGGSYSAFAHPLEGFVLQVECYFPIGRG